LPLAGGIIFLIFLIFLVSITIAVIYGLYHLHTIGVIEVRIPKPFRIYCFKNYLSPEEKAEIAEKERKKRQMELERELKEREKFMPGYKGFNFEDSFFKDSYGEEDSIEEI